MWQLWQSQDFLLLPLVRLTLLVVTISLHWSVLLLSCLQAGLPQSAVVAAHGNFDSKWPLQPLVPCNLGPVLTLGHSGPQAHTSCHDLAVVLKLAYQWNILQLHRNCPWEEGIFLRCTVVS